MNGIHDMGGMQDFGPVRPEPNEPVFHEPWEGRVLAMQRAMGYVRLWTIDMSRWSLEQLPPQQYLAVSYYERWALGLEHRLRTLDLVGADEIEAGHALRPGKTLPRKLVPADIAAVTTRGSYDRPPQAPARFKPGDAVRARNINPVGHTRLPRYARGRAGTIERIQGCHVFPDAAALGAGDDPQWLYTVLFDGRELWGEGADPTLQVSIEAFEPYLELA
jgi:nitrile hydratase